MQKLCLKISIVQITDIRYEKVRENEIELKVASKAYKNIMKKYYRKFKKFNVN